MTTTLAPTSTAPARPRVWPPAVALALLALGFGLFLLLPYYANGLHHEPLADVAAGLHDPKDLWPLSGPGAFAMASGYGGLLVALFGSLAAPVLPVWAAVLGWSGRGRLSGGRRWLLGAVVVAGIGLAAWVYSPFAQALIAWRLD